MALATPMNGQITDAVTQADGKVKWLGALLVLQLLLAMVLGFGGTGMEPAGNQGPLIALDPEQVTDIRIQGPQGDSAEDASDGSGKSVQVTQIEDGWVIPALGDLPAAEHKVTGLLEKLAGLKKGLPVATSKEALERFKVSDEAFERKLTLAGGDAPPVVLYLGDSPGFRRLFVRVDGEDAVFDLELGLFDAPSRPDDWADRTLLHQKEEDLKRLTVQGIVLERKEEGWQLADLTADEEPDQAAIDKLVRDLAGLDFTRVLGEGEEPAVDQDEAPTAIAAVLKSDEAIDYRITKLAEGNDYLLQVSTRPQRFTLAVYVAEDLAGIERTDLLQEDEEGAEMASEEPSSVRAAEEDAVDPQTRDRVSAPGEER